VGVMLIVLGLMNVVSFFRSMTTPDLQAAEASAVSHSHAHSHGDYIHSHAHGHSPEAHPHRPDQTPLSYLAEAHQHRPDQTPLSYLDRALGGVSLYQYARPLIVGIVHGLAGSAAVALLVLTTIRNPQWGIAYLLLFGIGTIAGMMLITMSIASTLRVVGRTQSFARVLAMASGVLSLAFGLFVAYQICVVNGLFTGHPSWTPR
jgi:high-affinity nickel-transport protein